MENNNQLGIWGNEECVQCGACCYDLWSQPDMESRDGMCEHQEIRDGKSYCLIHDREERDLLCRGYFCSGEHSNSDVCYNSTKERMRGIAEGLRTAPTCVEVL